LHPCPSLLRRGKEKKNKRINISFSLDEEKVRMMVKAQDKAPGKLF
jgi:hypothetical protein